MKYILVFIASVFACLLMLLLERFAGIEWDYHPDVFTYINDSAWVVEQGWSAIPNQLYYFVTYALGSSVMLMIALNILGYSFANMLIAKTFFAFAKQRSLKPKVTFVLLILLLIAPYRLHLAVHGLKDTLIILMLFLAATTYSTRAYLFLSWMLLMLLRVYSLLYALLFLRGRTLFALAGVMLLVLLYFDLSIIGLLEGRSDVGMHAREYDVIPSFSEYGLVGVLLRMITWPLMLLTGTFVLISPTIWFLPLSFEMLLTRVVSKKMFGHFGVTLGLVVCLSMIAAVVDSFTSYMRYVYPAILVTPIILMRLAIFDYQRQ